MTPSHPQIVLRLGAHAEKEYFERLVKSLDAVIFGANLLEITKAATCSLVLSLRAKRNGSPLPFYLDPMTYAFGPYIDPATGHERRDLEALKSEQSEKRGSKKKVRKVKNSYASIADELGAPFKSACGDGKKCTAIDALAMTSPQRDAMCDAVVNYQLTRLQSILDNDEFMKQEFAETVEPSAVFAPYFYIDKKWQEDGLKTALDLAARAVALKPAAPVHAIICATSEVLDSVGAVNYIVDELPKTGVAGVWLWLNGFDELQALTDALVAFRRIVRGLVRNMEVYNLHGGYFSLLLWHDGMSGISHGVGYGERKEVAQVIGPTAPTVRYYLPPIRKRIGVPDIQRCFTDVGILSPADFFAKVCDCQICKGVIGKDLSRFASFGEMHRATPASGRDSQTPTAAKLCRFHFLINRMKEKSEVTRLAPADRPSHVASRAAPWRDLYPLRSYLGEPGAEGYLERWQEALA